MGAVKNLLSSTTTKTKRAFSIVALVTLSSSRSEAIRRIIITEMRTVFSSPVGYKRATINAVVTDQTT